MRIINVFKCIKIIELVCIDCYGKLNTFLRVIFSLDVFNGYIFKEIISERVGEGKS